MLHEKEEKYAAAGLSQTTQSPLVTFGKMMKRFLNIHQGNKHVCNISNHF